VSLLPLSAVLPFWRAARLGLLTAPAAAVPLATAGAAGGGPMTLTSNLRPETSTV